MFIRFFVDSLINFITILPPPPSLVLLSRLVQNLSLPEDSPREDSSLAYVRLRSIGMIFVSFWSHCTLTNTKIYRLTSQKIFFLIFFSNWFVSNNTVRVFKIQIHKDFSRKFSQKRSREKPWFFNRPTRYTLFFYSHAVITKNLHNNKLNTSPLSSSTHAQHHQKQSTPLKNLIHTRVCWCWKKNFF